MSFSSSFKNECSSSKGKAENQHSRNIKSEEEPKQVVKELQVKKENSLEKEEKECEQESGEKLEEVVKESQVKSEMEKLLEEKECEQKNKMSVEKTDTQDICGTPGMNNSNNYKLTIILKTNGPPNSSSSSDSTFTTNSSDSTSTTSVSSSSVTSSSSNFENLPKRKCYNQRKPIAKGQKRGSNSSSSSSDFSTNEITTTISFSSSVTSFSNSRNLRKRKLSFHEKRITKRQRRDSYNSNSSSD